MAASFSAASFASLASRALRVVNVDVVEVEGTFALVVLSRGGDLSITLLLGIV